MLAQLAIGVALIYAALCLLLYFAQRSMLYFPTPAARSTGTPVLTLEREGERLLVSTRPAAGPNAVLYFGGNAEDVSGTLPELREAFPDAALYLPHYRGYGGSSGSPTEAALFGDALALYDHVHAMHANITLIGRSLGSGLAVRVASQRPVQRLVLITPYDSVQDIAARSFPWVPVRLLLRDRYESWRYAPLVTAPTLIIEAEHDEVIPRASTDLLRTRFRQDLVRFAVIPGTDHNDVSDGPAFLPLLRGDQ